MSRSADEVRTRSARLNPDRTEQLNPEQLQELKREQDSIDEASAELLRRFGARSSSGSKVSRSSSVREGGRGAPVRPATGPVVALLQLVLAALAGEPKSGLTCILGLAGFGLGCMVGCGQLVFIKIHSVTTW
jgi:hypothetical protein